MFDTDRLRVCPWHEHAWPLGSDLIGFLCEVLTEPVTAPLPPDWHGARSPDPAAEGPYDRERAAARIERCDREGATSLVVVKGVEEPIGLLFSYGTAARRIGYLLRESAWNQGYATELVAGFVRACAQQGVASITGGVERANLASARVLEKNGFVRDGQSEDGVVEFFTLTGIDMQAFYRREGDTFHPTVFTRGPWDERAQHGGPPSALLLRAMSERVAGAADVEFAIARLTTEFLRPVPLEPLTTRVELKLGRTAARLSAQLVADGRELMNASAIFLRQDRSVAPPSARPAGHREEEWPHPAQADPFVFPFFQHDEGYHRAVEIRLLDPPWGTTPARVWVKPTVDLVEGSAITAEEAVVVVADAESGLGPPLSPDLHTFLNPDLTVYFGRRPDPGHIGMAIRSFAGDAGVGLSEASLRDARGIFGRSVQSLVISPRA